MAKKKTVPAQPKLTESEQDLLAHMEKGYQLQTDLVGADPVLRKGDEEVRPVSANRATIKAMEERGLIRSGKGREPLTLAWHLPRKAK